MTAKIQNSELGNSVKHPQTPSGQAGVCPPLGLLCTELGLAQVIFPKPILAHIQPYGAAEKLGMPAFIRPPVHSLNNYLLGAYCVPGTGSMLDICH